jgi:hypothetical protein
MGKGKQAGLSHTEEQVAALSLTELNGQIARALWGYENSGTSQGRKAAFKRLIWLEAQREQMHAVTAKKRRFNSG